MGRIAVIAITFLMPFITALGQGWMPDTMGCGWQVVSHEGYVLAYDECHEQARWVAYMLTRERVNGQVPRGKDFEIDTMVETGCATLEDYRGSGYDRGHLAPAADMKWGKQVMRESFLMSNMSPQRRSFNDGIWKVMEEQVRAWALEYDTLYVVTGPVLEYDLETIGYNGVSVPEYFYKVVLDPKRNKGIGLLTEHRNSKRPPKDFAVTIDKVEEVTGLDFFPGLEGEADVESDNCFECWKWTK